MCLLLLLLSDLFHNYSHSTVSFQNFKKKKKRRKIPNSTIFIVDYIAVTKSRLLCLKNWLMERFSQRESILLGYSHQRSFLNDKTSDRDSDVDFNDVFGGPPRRFSINHETRYSFSEATADDNGLKGEDETTVSRNSWNGLSEKPVFGEEGLSRRRLTSENFFNDIYKGNECLSSSPRKRDWDPYGSSPGSRVLSPARPLPPAAEPFGASAPAQFRFICFTFSVLLCTIHVCS